ncbi:tape measure protein [Aureimonas altamirensis]|uniref:tape measure protein n=1 Tax=Aureimonas altamirensis TaxID=370622 RepID=UPI002037509F|nr:tape measure protein [Aureimonas altamirensis]MCM2504563.1 tape measure protein [Aureimonas altamirensis]
MASEVERLLVRLEVSQNKFERQMAAISSSADRSARRVESRFASMNKKLQSQFSGLGGLAGAFAGIASARGAQQLLDAATRITNSLRVAGLEGEALTSVYNQLFESAQRNAVPIESLVTLYSRLTVAQKELNVSNQEIVQFTDLVGMSLRASGQSATEAQGALLQLSQALGGGVIQAEEYNSLLDGARPLLQAVAAGMKEAGGSVATLTQLVKSGQVSSEAFFRAGQAGAAILEQQLSGAETTISGSFVRLQNVLVDTARKLDEGTDASDRVSEALSALSKVIAETDFSPLIQGAMDFAGALIGVIGKIQEMAGARLVT